jgi:hypothetical protein
MTKYFVDAGGNYLGGFDGAQPPNGPVEVPAPPAHGRDKWQNGAWVPLAASVIADEAEDACKAALLNGVSLGLDLRKLIKAKFVSDLAFRLGKAPGALTNAELQAERDRIAAIYKNL